MNQSLNASGFRPHWKPSLKKFSLIFVVLMEGKFLIIFLTFIPAFIVLHGIILIGLEKIRGV